MSHENNHNGFLKLMKTDAAEELVVNFHNAFLLLTIIALRARRRNGFNRHKLEIGQAMVGDHKACGLTRQEYRTAMKFLQDHGFATFQPTTKGTIATIVDSRVYDINIEDGNHQKNHQATIKQPSPNHQLTTNEEGKKDKKGKNERIYNVEAEGILTYLNEKTGRQFQAVDTTLSHIRNRLGEVSGDVEGVKRMIDHQCERWNGTDMQEYLRPSTLFRKEKFHEYFANRNMPARPKQNGYANIHPMNRLKIIKEQIEAHPANITSIKHDENCGEEKKQELRNLRAKRDQLEAEIANG